MPLYILGSSLFGAELAAQLGLPYAFASHFAPRHLHEALAAYRREFKPSRQLSEPHAIAGVGVIAAESEESAGAQLEAARRIRARALFGRGKKLSEDDVTTLLESPQAAVVDEMLAYTAVGVAEEVTAYLERLRRRHRRRRADHRPLLRLGPEPAALGGAGGAGLSIAYYADLLAFAGSGRDGGLRLRRGPMVPARIDAGSLPWHRLDTFEKPLRRVPHQHVTAVGPGLNRHLGWEPIDVARLARQGDAVSSAPDDLDWDVDVGAVFESKPPGLCEMAREAVGSDGSARVLDRHISGNLARPGADRAKRERADNGGAKRSGSARADKATETPVGIEGEVGHERRPLAPKPGRRKGQNVGGSPELRQFQGRPSTR